MKFMLIQPPIEDFYTTAIRLYPLGLLYTAAVLQELGHTVEILDCLNPPKKRQLSIPQDFSYLESYFAHNPYLFKNYYRFGISDDDIVQRVQHAQADLIGISSQFTAYFASVAKLATLIKRNFNVPIFIGGHHATAFPHASAERCRAIDHVLVGPSETSIPRFTSELEKNSQKTFDWKYLQPPHGLIQATDYKIGKRPYISLVTSRGCPFRCQFCSVHNMFGRQIEYRQIQHVVHEMRENYIYRGVRLYNFEDDNLTFNRRWFLSFLGAIISDPVLADIELTAMNGLCYPTLNAQMLALMFKAGFRQINLSFVTRNATLRSRMNRQGSITKLETIIKKAREIGFFVTVYIIIGLPGQTYDEVKESIDYLLNLDVLVGPSIFYIPAGSALYDKLDITDSMRANWNLYRSSSFAVETRDLNRRQLVELFTYARRQNLAKKLEVKR
ncbi:radical SAM protein [candidate division KSB1 bacterium]|nr:B12-binding domain-containing radical SAM protein [candidate division KSB1 bacterium]RQW02662.1 MAG: radical SAM protein [candidate division KSB1 bacterium]